MPAADAFSSALAAHIGDHGRAIAARWLERLRSVVPMEANDIFPSDELLDHIPALIEALANFISAPGDYDVATNTFVVVKARELGVMRHRQHASVHQLLQEYELLRSILETFVLEHAEQVDPPPDPGSIIHCLRRINQGIAILTRTTVDTFIEQYTNTIKEQTGKLEAFNHMVSHELRQPLGALQTAAKLLRVEDEDSSRRERVVAAIERNVARMIELVTMITKVSGLRFSAEEQPGMQRVSLGALAHEAARQLRDFAAARDVELRIAPNLVGDVVVDVGRLQLILTNLLSNSIKYSDPSKEVRFVEVAQVDTAGSRCAFRVTDNGLGMDAEQLRSLFTPLYRGHAERDQDLGNEGLGLGLAIVRDCAEAIGATVTVEGSPGAGSTFTVVLPSQC